MVAVEQRGGQIVKQEHGLSSSELVTALRTLPPELYPRYFKIILGSKTEEGTIPFSTAKFRWAYRDREGMFTPDWYKPLEISPQGNPEQVRAIGQALLLGNKPAEVIYKADGEEYANKSAYKGFIDKELEQQIINGPYQINYAILAVTLYHLTGYSQGDYPDTTICFKKESNGEYSTDLTIAGGLSPKEENILRNWYSSLPFLHPIGQNK